MDDGTEVRARMRLMRILWLLLVADVAILGALATLLLVSDRPIVPEALTSESLSWLVVAAALTLLLAPMIGRRAAEAPPGSTRREIARRYQAGWIVGHALREVGGVAGVVVGMLAGSVPWTLGFAGASVAAMLLEPPREEELRARLRGSRAEPVEDAPL